MAKRDFRETIRQAFRAVRRRVSALFQNLNKGTDEAFSDEPIDFSAPSVPYYENIASRLNFARIALYMALLVFIIGTVISNHRLITYDNLYYLVRDIGASTTTAQSQAERLSYPVSSSDADFASFRGGVVIAGSEVVTVMSGSGRKTLSVNVDYADPEVRASDKYFITFDRGEPSFSVYNTFIQLKKELTDFPVYDAAVADNGTFAVLTRSRDYTSDVLVYGDNMELLCALHRTGYVTGISLSADGSVLGVVSIEDADGVLETKITLVRLGSRITEESVTLRGSVGTTCGFTTNDRFAVLLSDRLLILKPDATITAEVLMNGRTPLRGRISGGNIAILSRDAADLSTEHLVTYDHNGRKLGEIALGSAHPVRQAGGVDGLSSAGNTLYVHTRDRLFWLDLGTLSVKASIPVSRDTLDILPLDGGTAMVCTPAYADRLSEKDAS